MGETQRNILRATILPLVSSTGMSFVAYTAFQYLFFPKVGDITKIYDFCVLMGFEFVLVCINTFLSALATRRTILYWFIIILFSVPFVYCFSIMMVDPTPMRDIIICVMLTHLIDMITLPKDESMLATAYYTLRVILYFFLLIFCCVFSGLLPECGLTKDFLTRANYEAIKKIGGIFTDGPHVGVIFGLLYYGIWSLGKFYFNIKELFKPHPVFTQKMHAHPQTIPSTNKPNKKRKK